jgi:hypothetical protein
MDLLAFQPAKVYPVGICTTLYQQACHVEGFVQGCKVQRCMAVIVFGLYVCIVLN